MWPAAQGAISCAARFSAAWAAVCFLRGTAEEPRERAVRLDPGATVLSARRGGKGTWPVRLREELRGLQTAPRAPPEPCSRVGAPTPLRARGTQPAPPSRTRARSRHTTRPRELRREPLVDTPRAPRVGARRRKPSGPGELLRGARCPGCRFELKSEGGPRTLGCQERAEKWARRGRFRDCLRLGKASRENRLCLPRPPPCLQGTRESDLHADRHGENGLRPLFLSVSRLFVYGLCPISSSQLILFKRSYPT